MDNVERIPTRNPLTTTYKREPVWGIICTVSNMNIIEKITLEPLIFVVSYNILYLWQGRTRKDIIPTL